MAQKIVPLSVRPFLDLNGDPYSGAQLFAYTAGSATKVTLTQDEAGVVSHANPIILNTRGEIANGAGATKLAWQEEGTKLDLVLAPSTDTDPPVSAISTWEDMSGINDTTTTNDQWVGGPAPTYVSASTFTLVGDQTTEFHVGRRLKTTNTGGTVYGTISVSAYTSLTTITIITDSSTLDSGLSAVSYGFLTQTNKSLPLDASAVYIGTAQGTADVLTVAAVPKLHLLNDKTAIRVKSAAANATTTPTVNVDALGAKTITKNGNQALEIGDIPRADYEMELRYNSSNDVWELLNPASELEIQSITATVAASALTLTLKAGVLDFRGTPITNGITSSRAFADLVLVVPSTATLGTTSGAESELILFAIDNAGTTELAVGNNSGIPDLSEENLISTTAIGTGSDSNSVIYSEFARTDVAFRVVGRVISTQATAGTWATAPSNLQGGGGRAIAGGAGAGASLVLLANTTLADDATADFTGLSDTYDEYLFIMTNIVPNTDSAYLTMRVGDSGSYRSDGTYRFHTSVLSDTSASYAGNVATTGTSITLTDNIGNATAESFSCEVRLSAPANVNSVKPIYWQGYSVDNLAQGTTVVGGGGYYGTVLTVDRVQFLLSSGTISSGKIRLYGIKKA